MAYSVAVPPETAGSANESDYGSDFSTGEEELLNEILSQNEGNIGLVYLEDNPIINDIEQHDPPGILRLPPGSQTSAWETSGQNLSLQPNSALPVEPYYPDLSAQVEKLRSEAPRPSIASLPTEDTNDSRTPLERFRSPPMKSFSVTDIVSPAWCELQYFYTLKHHGRKRQTPQMKQGTKVHAALEQELYTTVTIETPTKEDAMALHIWNVIQGLRTLQEIGHTRELEIWGVVDGQLVNGVIDEISFNCPDVELETEGQQLIKGRNLKTARLETDQTTIPEMFKSSPGRKKNARQSRSDKLYLCDVKTRAGSTIPNKASFRPTQYQLLLYHHLIGELASNDVDFSVITQRKGLDGDRPLSDSFIAKIGSLEDHVVSSSPEIAYTSSPFSTQNSLETLLSYNSLNKLWSLMISIFQEVLPEGRASLGRVLRAEYRTRDTGEVIGNKRFLMDEDVLLRYLDHEMEWWRGERKPDGVDMEEAFKCRTCDFADTCEWRLGKAEEAWKDTKAAKAGTRLAGMSLQDALKKQNGAGWKSVANGQAAGPLSSW